MPLKRKPRPSPNKWRHSRQRRHAARRRCDVIIFATIYLLGDAIIKKIFKC
jgi:hypothetical protein